MARGSTKPLTEMGTRNLPRGKEQPAHKADNLIGICEPIVYKMREPRRLTNLWASAVCYRDIFTFMLMEIHWISTVYFISGLFCKT
jgi:hypothetical protein